MRRQAIEMVFTDKLLNIGHPLGSGSVDLGDMRHAAGLPTTSSGGWYEPGLGQHNWLLSQGGHLRVTDPGEARGGRVCSACEAAFRQDVSLNGWTGLHERMRRQAIEMVFTNKLLKIEHPLGSGGVELGDMRQAAGLPATSSGGCDEPGLGQHNWLFGQLGVIDALAQCGLCA